MVDRKLDKSNIPSSVDVLGIGGSLVDTFYLVPEYPAEDTKLKAQAIWTQCGGPVASALVAVSRLGMPCAYAGSMGDDAAGQAMMSDFARYGIDASSVIVRPGRISASCIIIISDQKKTRTIIWSPGDAAPLEPDEIPEHLVRQAKVLHLDGLQHNAALAAARRFKADGKIVSIDAGSFHPGVETLLPLADWLICAEEFVLRLTGKQSAEEAVREVYRRYRPEVVAATQGKSGGIWTTDGNTIQRYLPVPVTVVDTTGAGDVFHGAAIYARLQDWGWPEVFSFASAVAALKCTKLGGRTGIPTRQEVDAYLMTQRGTAQ